MRQWLLKPPSGYDLTRLLTAWRLWLVGGLIGAGLGWALYQFAPPPYRAQATVVVDQNLELAYPEQPDREIFYFLARETLKLQEVAFSDDTLDAVSQQVKGVSISELRDGRLKLSQPSDGPWHFWADDPDADRAQELASTWAKAFVRYVHLAVDAGRALPAAREKLIDSGPDAVLATEVHQLEEQSRGVNVYVETTLSEGRQLPVVRTLGVGAYIFAGAVAIIALVSLGVLLSGGEEHAA